MIEKNIIDKNTYTITSDEYILICMKLPNGLEILKVML